MPSDEPRRKSRHYSLQQKRDAVVRVVKGEQVAAVSKDVGIDVNRLERWHARFMEAGVAALNQKHQQTTLYQTLKTHSAGISQWAGLLLVLAVVVYFLIRFLSSSE